jgi:hypothetical protein
METAMETATRIAMGTASETARMCLLRMEPAINMGTVRMEILMDRLRMEKDL